MIESLNTSLHNWLTGKGVTENFANILIDISNFILLVIACYLIYLIVRSLIRSFVHAFAAKTKSHWDDIMIKRKVFARISLLIPLIIFNLYFKYVLIDYPVLHALIQGLIEIMIVATSLTILLAVLNSLNEIYQSYDISKARPIKGYLQVAKIIVYILAGVYIISIFLGDKGFGWLAGFGAFSAVLMLVFKDPILGFVGGIQLTSNNMVKLGDWISMPKYGADGTVTDITLTTVKVQNWDKTITTIPTYTLVTDYFQNWRGMEESGGRRIKRSINIDMKSVKFCTPEMLEKYHKIHVLNTYLETKNKELVAHNEKFDLDNEILVNGRRQTNLGIFRAYLKAYLRNKPEVNLDMTFLVRQLQPTENGIPIEVYVFSRIQEWASYEDIQADIFDHILAVIPEFDLQVFQHPTGADFQRLGK